MTMEQEILLKELKHTFNELKKNLKFESDFEQIDRVFFVEDLILSRRYISSDFSRQLRSGMSDIFYSWVNYLQGLLLPSPSNITQMTESKIFSKEERNTISEIIKKFLTLTSTNNFILLTREKREEAEFIDTAVKTWENYFKPELTKIMKRINDEWEK